MADVGAELPHVCPFEHMDEWLEVAGLGLSTTPRSSLVDSQMSVSLRCTLNRRQAPQPIAPGRADPLVAGAADDTRQQHAAPRHDYSARRSMHPSPHRIPPSSRGSHQPEPDRESPAADPANHEGIQRDRSRQCLSERRDQVDGHSVMCEPGLRGKARIGRTVCPQTGLSPEDGQAVTLNSFRFLWRLALNRRHASRPSQG